MFMADLIKHIDTHMEIDFMDVSSYVGTKSTGEVKILKDLSTSVEGRHILIVEDIVETGTTLRENGLTVLEEVCPLSARMIVNPVSMRLENKRIKGLISNMRKLLDKEA